MLQNGKCHLIKFINQINGRIDIQQIVIGNSTSSLPVCLFQHTRKSASNRMLTHYSMPDGFVKGEFAEFLFFLKNLPRQRCAAGAAVVS